MRERSLDRDRMLQDIHERSDPWDLIVIGGGATGLGIALDACTRNLDTLLLEQGDFARATSSRSTKLIHGGVRYLRSGDLSLVREALRERRRLIRIAPHLVRERSFVIPAYRMFSRPYYWFGLKLYDQLSGGQKFPGSNWLSAEQTTTLLPGVQTDGLRGGVEYFDGQFDDARFAVHLARTIENHGGRLLNYAPVEGLAADEKGLHSVQVLDQESGDQHRFQAQSVVNATGSFADTVRRMDDPTVEPVITHSQGTHVVLPGSSLPGESALMIPQTEDGRVLFAIPWHNRILVGTTDVPVARAEPEPVPTGEEINYLLGHLNDYLENPVERSDIQAVFAGLRPLVSEKSGTDTAAISRDHRILISDSGMISVLGGKWTTYRTMAEDAVDVLIDRLGLPDTPCRTHELQLHGAEEVNHEDPMAVYGRDRAPIRQLGEKVPGGNRPLHPDLPYPRAVVHWAVRHEMARTVEDVLARRTRSLLINARAASDAANDVARILSRERGRSDRWAERQVTSFQNLARQYEAASE